MEEILRGHLTKTNIETVTAYTAAMTLYGNSQRSGVITNLTVAEFNIREEEKDGFVVIPCVNHKTSGQGLAQLVVNEATEEMLIKYYENIRIKLEPADDCQDNFFLTYNGQKYTQVYRKIQTALSIGNLKPPVPKEYRVLVSSEARRMLDEQKKSNIIKHLCHSAQTSSKYYEFMNTTDAMEAHKSIYTLSLARRWSTEEISLLTNAWPLTGTAPTTKGCRQFIQCHNLSRSPKDIAFKWKTLKNNISFNSHI